MFPKLFDLGPLTVYSYGVLLAAAYLGGLQFALVRARSRGLDAARVMDLGIYIIVSALVGAKLLLVLVDADHFLREPADLLSLARSGGVFYGGLILAVIVGLWYVRKHQLPTWRIADVIAPGIAFGHVVGRLGCFLAGCCYGHETDRAVGRDVHQPARAGERRHAAGRAAAPHAALRGGRRSGHPGACCSRSSTRGGAFPGTHLLGLHAACTACRGS